MSSGRYLRVRVPAFRSAAAAAAARPALFARIALGAFGAWVASIGARALLRGHPFSANAPVGRWLIGGVIAHDAVIAPVVFLASAAMVRLTGPRTRQALAALLLIGGSVLIVGLPDVLRKGHNPNPTVTPLDYTRNLAVVLLAVAGGVLLTTAASAARAARRRRLCRGAEVSAAVRAAPAEAREGRIVNDDANRTTAVESGAAESGAGESSAVESSAVESGAVESGAGESGG
ncbi:hypothetical protein KGA66_09240 [Actinocrinis puniceicyclus]|uniref:Uncharacterized protein n=1 Tax=Actinocrinis puniceicyclus TaxID=977794 RepID=A0A8J7WPM7_9ACTN|nr:hypothetical protein [Actinocrinis puniceicyclus]MBS2963229.1 hypothetical protein [Actinocrinis puniceicyclus]